MIIKTLTVGWYGTNCYIVGAEDSSEGMIIDPGDEANKILRKVKDTNLDIRLIVITHGHPDHTGALEEVKVKTKAKICIHKNDAGDLPAGLSPEISLTGGETLRIGNLSFLVLHTPGHSSGGICLYGNGVVFCGDTLFHYSVGRTDFPGGSSSLLMNSIFTKLLVLPDSTVIYPGHESSSTIGDERRNNPFLRE